LTGEISLDTLEAVRNQFLAITELPEEEIDLIDAALLIARTTYPRLDKTIYQQYLNDLTDRLRSRFDETKIEKLKKRTTWIH
jgi:uncharacterized protein YbaP (TraB family)